MNKVILSVLILLLSFLGDAQTTSKQVAFDDQWLFQKGDNKEWADVGYNAAHWKTVTTTKTLEEQGYENFEGYAWCRKKVVLPDSIKRALPASGYLIVAYRQVDDCDELYFNGHLIGRTGSFPPAYVSAYSEPREYRVPVKYLVLNGPNTIAVRIYDGGGGGGILSPDVVVRSATVFDNVGMKISVPDKDKIFLAPLTQSVQVVFTNTNSLPFTATVHVKITTDDYKPLQQLKQTIILEKGGGATKTFNYKPALPGFYRYTVYLEQGGQSGKSKTFNLGYQPEKIGAPPDAKPDFGSFWSQTLNELRSIDPNYKMTADTQYSNADYEVFEVGMTSLGNELVKGYYCKPRREGKFPVTIEYQGYGSGPYAPNTKWDGFAHMVMSVRGQGYNKPGNKYGDWIVYGLQSKESYYYRGAYMDVVRGIDFVCTRPEIDKTKIATMGGSQGGAFAFVSAALDKRVSACAPTIPFLSDYKNYFRIVNWPRSSFETYRIDHPEVSWDHIYNLLSYFDIKNLAQWIKAPLFMGIGVQDEVCPPHINFAAFNNVKAPKKWIAYGDMGHSTGPDFEDKKQAFFNKVLGIKPKF